MPLPRTRQVVARIPLPATPGTLPACGSYD